MEGINITSKNNKRSSRGLDEEIRFGVLFARNVSFAMKPTRLL
jgi:hypothetical protein